MRFFRNLPIGRKLTVITMAISGVALLLAGTALALYEQASLRRTMERDFAILADIFDDNVASGLAFNDPASIEATLKSLNAHQRVVAAAVYDRQGKLVAQYRRAGARDGFEFPTGRLTGQRIDGERLDTFKNIVLAGETIGVVYIGADLGELRERAWLYTEIVGGLLVVCSLVALILTARFQRIVSGPIEELAHTVATVAAEKNYAVRAHKQSDDELGRLIDGFNEMLVQIQARDAALRRAHDELEGRVQERTRELQQEIAERRRSEEALRESHQRFEMVTQATSDVIWDRNMLTNTVWRNENFQAVFGYRPEEIEFTLEGWSSCVHPDDLPGTLKGLAETLESGGKLWSSEYRFRRRDGTYAAILDRGHVIRDEQGRPIRMIGAMQNITALKEAETKLAYERDQLRALLESSPDTIYFKDLQSRFVRVSLSKVRKTLERLTDLRARLDVNGAGAAVSEADLLNGLTDFDIFDQEDARCAYEDEQQVIRSGRPLVDKLEKQNFLDGSVHWNLTNKMPWRDRDGNVIGTFGISKDITPLKVAEEKLAEMHRQLLEVSRQAGMAEVATGVLHNVGNVLNSVNVSATLVMDQMRDSKVVNLSKIGAMLRERAGDLAHFLTNDPKGQRIPAYLITVAEQIAAERKDVAEELGHLRKNIEHIRDIVAMQQSYAKVSGVTETVAVSEMVEDALRMNASGLSRHGIEVVRDYHAQPTLTTERHKVMQVLVNLIRNAKQSCDDSGRENKQVIVRIVCEGARIRVSVIDNGVGIPPENLTRIFAHGFTTKQKGNGIGLHSCALVARELRGSLIAQSDGPGQGATFTLELPYHPEGGAT